MFRPAIQIGIVSCIVFLLCLIGNPSGHFQQFAVAFTGSVAMVCGCFVLMEFVLFTFGQPKTMFHEKNWQSFLK